jgi:exo-beta-1,3-glucanase (GH17 family)
LTETQAIGYVEQVRKAVRCPVTIADDFLYWQQPQAQLADHVDFITMHAYPMWGREDIGTAMASTIKDYESVRKAHPGQTVVIGEAGWASYTVGPQHVNAWAKVNNVTVFYFEAFDESWKGTGTEGHWGLFSEDRKAKLAMQGLYPELMPAGPTSPSYDSQPSAK